MKKQDLINHIEEVKGDKPHYREQYHLGRWQAIEGVLELINQLDEPEITEEQAWEVIGGYNGMTAKEANQMFADGMVNRKSDKSIKRDDVLDRLQEIGEHNRNEWIEVILRVFGNDYGTAKYREGYEQGVLNGILTSNKNKLVEVPQFVADWIESEKEGYKEWNEASAGDFIMRCSNDLFRFGEGNRPYDFEINDAISKWTLKFPHIFIRAVLDGYTIESPKTLQVIVKNYDSTIYKTDIPEDEAMKLIEGWKEDDE